MIGKCLNVSNLFVRFNKTELTSVKRKPRFETSLKNFLNFGDIMSYEHLFIPYNILRLIRNPKCKQNSGRQLLVIFLRLKYTFQRESSSR